jgi:hypothetical protein
MGIDKLTAVADRGYYKSEEIRAWSFRQGRLHLQRKDERISVSGR